MIFVIGEFVYAWHDDYVSVSISNAAARADAYGNDPKYGCGLEHVEYPTPHNWWEVFR